MRCGIGHLPLYLINCILPFLLTLMTLPLKMNTSPDPESCRPSARLTPPDVAVLCEVKTCMCAFEQGLEHEPLGGHCPGHCCSCSESTQQGNADPQILLTEIMDVMREDAESLRKLEKDRDTKSFSRDALVVRPCFSRAASRASTCRLGASPRFSACSSHSRTQVTH